MAATEEPYAHAGPTFPAFLIVAGADRPLIVDAEGRDCFLLYGTRELAELYIEPHGGKYQPQQIDESELRSLVSRNIDVPYIAWNAVAGARTAILFPTSHFR